MHKLKHHTVSLVSETQIINKQQNKKKSADRSFSSGKISRDRDREEGGQGMEMKKGINMLYANTNSKQRM